jgi:hypothetical protein
LDQRTKPLKLSSSVPRAANRDPVKILPEGNPVQRLDGEICTLRRRRLIRLGSWRHKVENSDCTGHQRNTRSGHRDRRGDGLGDPGNPSDASVPVW